MDTFWDKVITAGIGVITGGIGSLIAPWWNWRIELKRLRFQQKKDTIAKWRTMLAEAIQKSAEKGDEIQKFLEANADFYSLQEQLAPDTINGLFGRTFVVPPDRSTVDGVVGLIGRDISAAERKWKGRPE
jgi:hypothetical protein